jgi:RimJ/RimL family protein N-acetyltransferase
MNLRPMTMEDADKMLEWKNYPETRKFAIVTNAEIRRDDHLKYIENNLQYFQIIRVEGEVVGAVRVKDNDISIWIDRDFWRHGLATEAIKMVSVKGMTAKIVSGNIGSMRAFIKAGYFPISYQDNYYIFQL